MQTTKCYFISCFLFLICSCETMKTTDPLTKEISAVDKINVPFETTSLDGVLISIQDQLILLSDLQEQVSVLSQGQTKLLPTGQMIGGNLQASDVQNLLDSMINQKILELKARDMGLQVPEDELAARIDEFLKKQNLSEEQLQTELQLEHISYDEYKENFRKEITKQELIGRVIAPTVSVTNDEVRAYFLKSTVKSKNIQSIQLRNLLIHLKENESENNNDNIKTVRKELQQKVPFEKIVAHYSQASDAKKTKGVLPYRDMNSLPKPLQALLPEKKEGDIIGPVSVGSSVFFFEVMHIEYASSDEALFREKYNEWKSKYQEVKFSEELDLYLSKEKRNYNIIKRDIQFFKL